MKVLTLRVGLNETDPDIWRRFQLTDEMMLFDLHIVIQIVMGWTISHLHEFQIEGKTYSEPSPDDEANDPPPMDERNVVIGDVINRVGQTFQYIYDMGDYWRHTLVVEEIVESAEVLPRPVCLAGQRECPPEDCGGILGYNEILKVLKYPQHEKYESNREWLPPDFDPAHFDLDDRNETLEDEYPADVNDDGIIRFNWKD